jgi:hypothetical protein
MSSRPRRFPRVVGYLSALMVGLALAAGSPGAAHADAYVPGCPYSGGGVPFLLVPADGEEELPLDAVVSVVYPGATPTPEQEAYLTDSITLRRAGEVVATTATLTLVPATAAGGPDAPNAIVRLTAGALLAPEAEYEVIFDDTITTPYRLGSFRTGTVADDTAPEAPAAPTIGRYNLCELFDDNCCECGSSLAVAVEIPAATERVTYTLRQGETLLAVDVQAPLHGISDCDAWNEVGQHRREGYPWHVAAGLHTLTIVARDRAGNESAPTSFELDAFCDPEHAATCPTGEEFPPDSGASQDGSADPDSGAGNNPGDGDDGDGCACRAGAGAAAGSLGSALLLAVAALVSLRRLGRQRRR